MTGLFFPREHRCPFAQSSCCVSVWFVLACFVLVLMFRVRDPCPVWFVLVIRVRARGSYPIIYHLNFALLTNKTNQTNSTNQLIAICHLVFRLPPFPSNLKHLPSFSGGEVDLPASSTPLHLVLSSSNVLWCSNRMEISITSRGQGREA